MMFQKMFYPRLFSHSIVVIPSESKEQCAVNEVVNSTVNRCVALRRCQQSVLASEAADLLMRTHTEKKAQACRDEGGRVFTPCTATCWSLEPIWFCFVLHVNWS